MAEMGWTARVVAAAGAAAGAGAAQLGLGYGLGVVVWPATNAPQDSTWTGSLGWALWITASATVFGAVLAARLRNTTRVRGLWRLALALSAAIGAWVAVALIALPARSEVHFDPYAPQLVAGGYAALGVLLGLVIAYWAVVSRPVAANLIVTGLWLWGLAIAAVVVDVTLHRKSATYLTSWQFAEAATHRYGIVYWPSALVTVCAAFLIGVLTVLPAIARNDFGAGAAVSGAVGPLLVALSFFALAPRLTSALGALESAYLIAPYAVLAGLAGSALAVSTARSVADRRARRSSPALPSETSDPATADATAKAAATPAEAAVTPPATESEPRRPFWRRRSTAASLAATEAAATTQARPGADPAAVPVTPLPPQPTSTGEIPVTGSIGDQAKPAVGRGRAKAQPKPATPSAEAATTATGRARSQAPATPDPLNGPTDELPNVAAGRQPSNVATGKASVDPSGPTDELPIISTGPTDELPLVTNRVAGPEVPADDVVADDQQPKRRGWLGWGRKDRKADSDPEDIAPTDHAVAPNQTIPARSGAPVAGNDQGPPLSAKATKATASSAIPQQPGSPDPSQLSAVTNSTGGPAPAYADPEIAAAARPKPGRPKKAAPKPVAEPRRATVTPPPAEPRVIQINPSPKDK